MSVEHAVDRLRTIERMEAASGTIFPSPMLQIADWQELAHAYLELFDPTPLSDEILRESGWGEGPYGYWVNPMCEFTFAKSSADGDTFYKVDAHPFDLGYIEIVGDLRRLLSALHIDVEVRLP